jgi:hypothetical protein
VGRLLLDHNISSGLEPLLGRAGHDVLATREPGGERWTDDALILFAVQQRRVFLTHNRSDFRLLHDAWVTWSAAFGMALPPHPGILVLDQVAPEILAPVVTAFLVMTPSERLASAIFWWRRHSGWQQPITGANWEPFQPPGDAAEE